MTKTYIMLGRYGDILTLLPLLYADAKRGERQTLMVAKEFAPLLEGVSYVDPLVYDGPHYEIGKAVEHAKSLGRPWVCPQILGPIEACREFVWKPAGATAHNCPSFEMEAYRMCGRLKEWNDDLPLVFDRRNKERESKLIERVLPKLRGPKKKLMLVCADGLSSPFPFKKLLLGLLEMKFAKQYRILNIGTVQAERFFDLLGLYDLADVLVAVDSGPLHLARACPKLPVVALTNDRPQLWNGSAWKPQHIVYCRYGDFPDRAFEILKTVEDFDDSISCRSVTVAWNAYDGKSAEVQFPFQGFPIQRGSCGRDSVNTITDALRAPYLKDALKMAIRKSSSFVCLTRPGTVVALDLHFCQSHNPSYAYRLTRNGNGDTFAPIIDLLCAKKEFWLEHMKEIPDLILGNDYYWSNVLWAMFKKYGAVDVTGCCWRGEKS